MFIGHPAVGFASKRLAPRTSLGWLIAAPMFADLLWPILLLLGIEHVRIAPGNTRMTPLDFYDYPWSHSLLTLTIWGALLAGAYWLRTRYARGAVLIWLGVISHWVLDWLTHRPDMPLRPGGPKYGLGLWNHVAVTLVIEVAIFVIGIAIYTRTTRAVDRKGSLGMWSFIIFLAVIYAGNLAGPPPPNVPAIAWTTMLTWLFPLWAWWFDRHREVVA
ncbi:MAG: hypothetical protein JWO56_1516 [Acidobacteria bacterium]|nr:hypothetical protein [Acidobacteriota bacterium]